MKLILAITRSRTVDSDFLKALNDKYGEFDDQTGEFGFDYTDYYESEMGSGLLKQFKSFKKLIGPEKLVEVKLEAMSVERQYAVHGKRQVNLDPMYLELAKLVVASHKNYAHRILIGKGVYGDVQLTYKNGQFRPNDWTYPDYVSEEVLSFFTRVREHYYQELKRL